jgi:dynein light chain roadblock-type
MVAKITLTPEIDESLKRIQDAKNVDGILLINREGIPIKTSLDSSVTAQVKQIFVEVDCEGLKQRAQIRDPREGSMRPGNNL